MDLKKKEHPMRSEWVEYDILLKASENHLSPMEIAALLSPEYTQTEVFEAVDRLSDQGRVYFDTENDLLIVLN